MKNKISKIIFTLSLALASVLLIASCGSDDQTETPAPHEHTFSEEWVSDASGHWHPATCEHIGEKSGYESHIIGADNDCVCDICGTETHSADLSTWFYDAEGHWHASTCGNSAHKFDYAEHSGDYDCDCDVCHHGSTDHTGMEDCVCDACGYESHTFTGAWVYDVSKHWHTGSCGNAEHIADAEDHVGMDDCICDICGYQDHDYSSEWSKDATHHWHSATCSHVNEKSDYGEHVDANKDNKCDSCGLETSSSGEIELPIIRA